MAVEVSEQGIDHEDVPESLSGTFYIGEFLVDIDQVNYLFVCVRMMFGLGVERTLPHIVEWDEQLVLPQEVLAKDDLFSSVRAELCLL